MTAKDTAIDRETYRETYRETERQRQDRGDKRENEKCLQCVISYTDPKQSLEGPRLSEPIEVRQQALPSLGCRNI